jgi:hypothetical protein
VAQALKSCYTDLLGHYPSSKPATINRTGYYKPNPLNTNYETAQVSEGVVVDSRRVVLGFCGEVGKRQRAIHQISTNIK